MHVVCANIFGAIVSPGSIGCAYTYSGPFREAQISEQSLWGFPQVILILSQSRAEHFVLKILFPFHDFTSFDHITSVVTPREINSTSTLGSPCVDILFSEWWLQ
jgi:hypothetical protein